MSRASVLVSGEWAEANLNTPGVVFVDVDEDASAYGAGHIPGAVKLDWMDLRGPTRRDLSVTKWFELLLSASGIANNDTIVLYGGSGNRIAAYAHWCFKLHGHEDVRLLAGGREKWETDGRPLTAEAVSRRPTKYASTDEDASMRAFRDEVLSGIETTCGDARSLEEIVAETRQRQIG